MRLTDVGAVYCLPDMILERSIEKGNFPCFQWKECTGSINDSEVKYCYLIFELGNGMTRRYTIYILIYFEVHLAYTMRFNLIFE